MRANFLIYSLCFSSSSSFCTFCKNHYNHKIILEHNGLETQYILQLQARHGHVMKFMRSRCIFNCLNTFWTNSLHVFSITETQFAYLIFIEHIGRYGCFVSTESKPRLVFTKPGKSPQKRLLRSESYASPTEPNHCTELKATSVPSLHSSLHTSGFKNEQLSFKSQ